MLLGGVAVRRIGGGAKRISGWVSVEALCCVGQADCQENLSMEEPESRATFYGCLRRRCVAQGRRSDGERGKSASLALATLNGFR